LNLAELDIGLEITWMIWIGMNKMRVAALVRKADELGRSVDQQEVTRLQLRLELESILLDLCRRVSTRRLLALVLSLEIQTVVAAVRLAQ
jgi:hypothetical protein